MKKQDERKFVEVVQSIVQSEADVDTILKAAKLERHEKPDNRLSAAQKIELIDSLTIPVFGVIAICFIAFLICILR